MPEEEKQRVNLFLDPDIVLQARMQALKESKTSKKRISLSELVDKALAKYIEEMKE